MKNTNPTLVLWTRFAALLACIAVIGTIVAVIHFPDKNENYDVDIDLNSEVTDAIDAILD